MKIKIKKFGTKIVVGTLIGLIFMSAVASRQGYVAEAKDPKPAPAPAIICPTKPVVFTSKDGFSCEAAIGDDGKLTGDDGKHVVAECPEGFNKASQDKDKLVCTKAVKSMANAEDLVKRMNVLIWIQGALNRLIWPVLVLIGGLMDNDLLFGNGMEERLREIWIPIRNLVNILFVLLLVGIALYSVLGIGGEGESSSLKSVLPKIIIGIIAINFSFLAIKVFLDAVNVMTTSVFSLPGQVSEGLSLIDAKEGGKDEESIKRLCQSLSGMSSQDFQTMTNEQMTDKDNTQIYKDAFNKVKSKYPDIITSPTPANIIEQIENEINYFSTESDPKNPAIKTEFDKDVEASKSGLICLGNELSTQGKIFLKRFNSSNAAFAMALLLGKIVYYQDLKVSDLSDIEKVAFNALFSMIFYFVYAASFVALLIVLLARLVIMWISIALSPVLILALASSTVKEKLGGFSKLTEQFTKMAIAPLIIAITMAIGWIMLRALQSINMFDSQSTLKINMANGIPVVGLSTIQDLVVACGTIAIVWLGVFAAAEGTIAEKLTGTMKDWLQTAGKWVGALPFRHIPFVPISIPGKEGEGPQHFTGAEVQQALSDVIRKGSEPQERLSELLEIRGKGKNDLRDVKTKDELYQHLDKKDVDDMISDSYVKELKRWKEDNDGAKGEFTKLDRENPDLARAIMALIDSKADEAARKKAAEDIKDHEDVKGSSFRTSTTPSPQPPATGKYKPVNDSSTVGGQTVATIETDTAKRQDAMTNYNRHGDKLSGDMDGLMKSKPDGRITKQEIKKLTDALRELRINGIGPTEAELRQQIGDEKVNYLVGAIGGKNGLETALGRPPAAPTQPPAPVPPVPPAPPQ